MEKGRSVVFGSSVEPTGKYSDIKGDLLGRMKGWLEEIYFCKKAV